MAPADPSPVVLVDLDCPSCGGRLTPTAKDLTGHAVVRCPYCGGSVAVLRPGAAAPADGAAHAAQDTSVVPADGATRRGRPLVVAVVALLVATVCAGVVVTLVRAGGTPGTGGDTSSVARRVATFAGQGTGPGFLDDPRHVAVAPDGTVWVADAFDGRVAAFGADGTFLRQFRVRPAGSPKLLVAGLAVTADGLVHVSDTGRIRTFDPTTGAEAGKPVGALGDGYGDLAVTTEGDLLAVRDDDTVDVVAVDAKGRTKVLVADVAASADPDDALSVVGLTVGGDDGVVLVSGSGPQVYRFTPAGAFADRFGTEGVGPGTLIFPQGVAVDGRGRVLLADGVELEVFTGAGEHVGTARLGADDGVSRDVAVGRDGRVYVVTDAGKVLTYAVRS